MGKIIDPTMLRFKKQLYESTSKVALKLLQTVIHDEQGAGKAEVKFNLPNSLETGVMVILVKLGVEAKPEEPKAEEN